RKSEWWSDTHPTGVTSPVTMKPVATGAIRIARVKAPRVALASPSEVDWPAPSALYSVSMAHPEGQPLTPFVGRDDELAHLWRGIERAVAGRGSLHLLVGEPGIGKTRLADELAMRAAAHPITTLWGRCWESGGAPAYWPWV